MGAHACVLVRVHFSSLRAHNHHSSLSLRLPRIGARLFRNFSILELRTQQRAPDDPQHVEFINNVYDGVNRPPIHRRHLRLYKHLQASDLRSQEWRTATILVSSNAQRELLNLRQAIRFAEEQGVPVVRWRLPAHGQQLGDDVYQRNPCLWGLFVPGAPAMLTENLSVKRGLCNGTIVRMHSLTFDNKTADERHRCFVFQNNFDHALPGQVVDLEPGFRPLTINVTLNSSATAGTPTLVANEFVIPIRAPAVDGSLRSMTKSWVKTVDGFQRVFLADHEVTLAFALTFWKVRCLASHLRVRRARWCRRCTGA